MDNTPNLKLPYIAPAQAQKHVTHNEAIRALDAIVQLSVLDKDVATPPASPAEGDRYIVAPGASGAWAGATHSVAAWQDGAWALYVPLAGWLAWLADEARLYAFDGTQWVVAGGESIDPAPLVGVNTTADATNRLAVKSDAILLSHDDVTPGTGDVQAKLNKATAGGTASMLFQSNWSGRAEMGLTGDDNWHIKVSANGSTWREAMIIDAATGNIGIGGQSPATTPLLVTISSANYPTVENCVNGANAAGADFKKSRGTPTAKAAVVANDTLLACRAWGYDGATYLTAGNFRYVVDGTPSPGVMPGSLQVTTVTAGVGNTVKLAVRSSGATEPGADNAFTLGSAGARWSVVYAATGTINTSDARDKDVVSGIGFAGKFIDAVAPVLYRWKIGGTELVASQTETEVDVDGNVVAKVERLSKPGKRVHAGFLAQDVKAAMHATGIDFGAWGLDDKGDPESRQWVRPDQLVPILWQAVRELRAEIAALTTARG